MEIFLCHLLASGGERFQCYCHPPWSWCWCCPPSWCPPPCHRSRRRSRRSKMVDGNTKRGWTVHGFTPESSRQWAWLVELKNDGFAADNDVRSDGQLSKRRNVMVVRSESICPTIKVLKLICPTISETRKISFVLQEQSQVNFFCVCGQFFVCFFVHQEQHLGNLQIM